METTEKKLSEISRKDWIAFRWQEAPMSMGDDERVFFQAGRRTPEEAYRAMEEWDMTADERECEPEAEKGNVQ